MSKQFLHQDMHLSDSLERSIMNAALSNGETVSITKLSKNVLSFFVKSLKSFGNYMIKLSEHISEARYTNEKFARSHW